MSTETISQVPLLDLNAQYEPIKDAVIAEITNVFESKQFILGPKIDKLEQEITDYCGTTHAIGVSSGSDALIIALMALEIGHGDEVITTPFTFFATAGAIARVGAKPVFVDIDPQTFNMDVTQIESKLTANTKAIMPVHLFGQMADMDAIMAISTAHNLHVIEDAAQAIGSRYTGRDGVARSAGSIGTVGCFSFFPSKNLGACGDGGIVTCNDDALAQKIRQFRMHGETKRYHHDYIGGNFRLDPIQAAVLSVKLPYLDAQHDGRRRNAAFYESNLSSNVIKPVVAEFATSIYNQYTVRSDRRDALKAHLDANKVGNNIYYPVPLHMQKCFDYLGHKEGAFPEAERAAKEVLSLPVFSELTEAQLQYVVDVIGQF